MTPKTTKAERNAKREEFTRAALLYCSAMDLPDDNPDRLSCVVKASAAMLKAYRAMEEK